MWKKILLAVVIILVIVLILGVVFNNYIMTQLGELEKEAEEEEKKLKKELEEDKNSNKKDDDTKENLSSDWMQHGSVLDQLPLYENPDYTPNIGVGDPPYTVDNPLKKTWHDYLRETELDPSVKANHQQFITDISKFYTGAHFTEVADDNRTVASTNFRGLRRPKHVFIGPDARQQPDVDQNVLKRNRRFLL